MNHNPPDELRFAVASAHGLSEDAMPFLFGATLEELEVNADALVALLGARRERTEERWSPSLGDLLTDRASFKTRRQHHLIQALHGRTPQPRDERGRWTGFDGGARPLPPRRPETHEEWLTGVLRTRAADRGANF
jgi:hypothetical protein